MFCGVDVEEDALVSDDDAFKVGPGKVRFLKKGRINALVDKPGAHIDPANYQATQFLKEDIQTNAGVTPELLGQAEDSDVGITEQLRQGAALTTLQELFDNLDLSQRNAGRLHWALIQKNYTLGKIRKMIQEEPTNEFRDKSFQKYDAVVTDAPLTSTTKQLAFLQKYTMWKDGLPIPMDALLADLTIQDKDKMVKKMEEQQQQQAKQQEQMTQLQMQNQQIVNESLQSKAMSDRALAEERIQKGHLEQFQIMTAHYKAEHEKAAATLDTVRAAKDLETVDVDNFEKIIRLIHDIQSSENQHELAIQEANQAQSNPKINKG